MSQMHPGTVVLQELVIPHWREGLARIANDGYGNIPRTRELRKADALLQHESIVEKAPEIGVHGGHGKVKKIDRENRQWMLCFELFKELWSKRSNDAIKNDHLLEDWVTRQRKHYRNSTLMSWKLVLLTEIGFPFIASRKITTPTNLEYAQRLCIFYREHGHYAPTHTIGGVGLTKWVRNMRESNGAVGLVSGTQESAHQARQYLIDNVSGFSFDNTFKVVNNQKMGLSFNGYAAGESRKWPTKLLQQFRERATNSISYPVALKRIVCPQGNEIRKICARAAFYEQAIRVCVNEVDDIDIWWLHSADNSGITLHRALSKGDNTETKDEGITFAVTSIGRCQYNQDAGTFELLLQCEGGIEVILDYDSCLADQSHRYMHPLDFNDYEESCDVKKRMVIDWPAWLDGRGRPMRLVGPLSTANVHFGKNLDLLVRFLKDLKARNNVLPHLTYTNAGDHYKFIEHSLLRARAHDIPPSHVERLQELDFVWGTNRKHVCNLLAEPKSKFLFTATTRASAQRRRQEWNDR